MFIIDGFNPISQNQLFKPTIAINKRVNPKYLLLEFLKNFENKITKLNVKQWRIAMSVKISKKEVLIISIFFR
jgi:hypothetical protein